MQNINVERYNMNQSSPFFPCKTKEIITCRGHKAQVRWRNDLQTVSTFEELEFTLIPNQIEYKNSCKKQHIPLKYWPSYIYWTYLNKMQRNWLQDPRATRLL